MLFSMAVTAKQGATAWGEFSFQRSGESRSLTPRTLISVPANGLFSLVQSDIERVLFDGPAIHKRLDEMAAQITADYSDRELTVIAILTGSLMFTSDLLRRIPLPFKLD